MKAVNFCRTIRLMAAGMALTAAMSAVAADDIHLFYLHGRIIEEAGPTPVHPEYGRYDYPAVVAALGARGARVISEVRPSGTDVDEYAGKTVAFIETLIASGVPPENIVVAGFSKGGSIAIRISDLLAHSDVRFVLLAACNERLEASPGLRLNGRIYSIFERSDEIGTSCAELADRGSGVVTFRELEIDTGQRHGAFYLPREEWVTPMLDWVHGDTG